MMMIYLAFMIPFENLEIGCPHSENLSEFCNFGAYVDRMIFGEFHMIYPNDPEGLFTNLNALISTYAGYCFCLIMQDHKNDHIGKTLKRWIIISLICGAVTYPLTFLMPLNKKIYSTSFLFITISISGLSLTLFAILIDVIGKDGNIVGKVITIISRPFIWLGRNPLAIFVLMDALAIVMIKYIIFDDKSLWSHFYHSAFESWI